MVNGDTHIYYFWGEDIPACFDRDRPSKAIVFATDEYEINPNWHLMPGFPEHCDLDIVTGSDDAAFYLRSPGIPKNARMHHWPTYWALRTHLTFTLHHLMHYAYPINTGREAWNVDHRDITIPFISLNNKARPHRCKLIDELAGRDLLIHGAVSFHEPKTPYPWKHWKPEHLILDPQFPELLDQYKIMPRGFNDSLVSLVAEVDMQNWIISEKTWTPIWHAKPVLIWGPAGINAKLAEFGIEQYDEIFDYGFDSIENDDLRLSALLDNLHSLIGQDLNLLRAKINDKALRNAENMLACIKSDRWVPDIVQQHIQLVKTGQRAKKYADEIYLTWWHLHSNEPRDNW